MAGYFRFDSVGSVLLGVLVMTSGYEKLSEQSDVAGEGKVRRAAARRDAASQFNSRPPEKGPLQLCLSAPKTTIIQCEPLPVKFELKNVSQKTLGVDIRLEPKWGQLVVEITPPGKDPYELTYPSPVTERNARDMQPRESVFHGRLLHHYSEPGLLFKRPGTYRIQARFDDSKLRAVSNTLVLTVLEAEGADAQALAEHWYGNPQGYFMMGATGDYFIAKEFRSILTKYPGCTYAPWCELALTRAHAREAAKDAQMRSDLGAKQDPHLMRIALREYEQFVRKHPDFPFPFSVSMPYSVAKMKLTLGRKEESLGEIAELFNEHRNVDFVREATRRIKQFEEIGRELTAAELP